MSVEKGEHGMQDKFWMAVLLVCAVAARTALAQDAGTDAVAKCRALQGNASAADLPRADFSLVAEAPTAVVNSKVAAARAEVPARCVVNGITGGTVGFRLELPLEKWNGKFIEMGCGGLCGIFFADNLDLPGDCDVALKRGYSCIIGDGGHKGGDGKWAYNNLQAEFDWGIRAAHITALAGKAITEYFYHAGPKYSYFMGCSGGGVQGLSETQRYPWDFNGVIAGDPRLHLLEGGHLPALWFHAVTHDYDGKPLLSREDYQLVDQFATAECDSADGLADGVITDPRACKLDLQKLACGAGKSSRCLTAAKIEAVAKAIDGPNIKGLERVGELPGSEWIRSGGAPIDGAIEAYRYLHFSPAPGPRWNIKDVDWANDFKRGATMDALYATFNPDLRRFQATGGKLMLYVGWSDHAKRAIEEIDYYETVERVIGGRRQTQDFFRLFAMPGMGHCRGGSGADSVDFLGYMEAWVEKNQPPDSMVASKLKPSTRAGELLFHAYPLSPDEVQFSRPLYPYPKQARYLGKGDANSAASFGPVEPKP
jgi:hypothetical protein